MQLVIFAVLGCCAFAHSASLSDSFALGQSGQEAKTSIIESSDLSDVDMSNEDTRRDKRSGLGGSGGFLAGIGSAILGKVAQASSGLSSGSSDARGSGHQYESVEYGAPVHGYNDEKNFDIWSFKKAILNTLFQALKAIGGGVIALKGKLIKGGGVLISAKGNIISAKGEAISTLGRHIAASAVLAPPKQSQGFLYEPPVHHVPSGHDSYGPPPPIAVFSPHGGYSSPSSDSYGHSAYAAPSDDAENPGLLIVKPLRQETNQHTYHTSYENESRQSNQQLPLLATLAQSFGGNQKSSGLENFISQLSRTSNSNGPVSSGKRAAPGTNVGVAGPAVEHKEQETHVVHNDEDSAGAEKVSPALDYSQQSVNQHQYNNQYEGQSLGFRAGAAAGPENYEPLGNGPLMFSMPIELPVLQTTHNQPNYFPGNNQLRDFGVALNSYNGDIKRSDRAESEAYFRIIPSIGYTVKNARIFRT